MKVSGRLGGALLFLLAGRDVTPLLGQQPHFWRVQGDVSIGAFLPASGLGTIGVTGAKYQPSSTLGVGIELRPRAGALGLRVSTQRSLSSGIDFHATQDCQQNCVGPWSVDHGRFWGAAIDAVARPISGPIDLTFALGGGLRQYHVGTFDCICIASPPGLRMRDLS